MPVLRRFGARGRSGDVTGNAPREPCEGLTSVLRSLAELPALPDPQLLLLLLFPGGHGRAAPGGLHDGGVRSAVQGGCGRLHGSRESGGGCGARSDWSIQPGCEPGGRRRLRLRASGRWGTNKLLRLLPAAASSLTSPPPGGGGGRWESGAASPRRPSPPRLREQRSTGGSGARLREERRVRGCPAPVPRGGAALRAGGNCFCGHRSPWRERLR